jgi:Na+/H+ antiporter NhaC
MSEKGRLEFRFGSFGKFIPIIIAVIFIFIAATQQSNISGYVVAFFMAIILSIPFVKSEKEYGDAIMRGLTRPMFAVISMAIILATISGKLISASGLVQTLASYVVKAGFTGGAFVAFSFLITCLLAFSTGTSVGTNLIVIPILFPVGVMAGAAPAFMIGSIVSGSAFGDNLAPISDTTIASAGTQGADLGGVVRSRSKYSLPVAAVAFILFAVFGGGGEKVTGLKISEAAINSMSLVMLVVPAVIITLCLMRKHLITALSYGVIAGLVVGIITKLYSFSDILAFPGGFKVTGIFIDSVTSAMSTVAMLVGVFALLGVMESSGVFESIGSVLSKTGRGIRSTEITIVASIAILGMITGVIAVGMIAIGDLIKSLGEKHGINKYRRANLMDCAGIAFCFLTPWTVHCVLPAQLSATFGDAFAVLPTSVATHNFYAICMVVMLIFSIITGYGRDTKIKKPTEKVESESALKQ